MSAQHRNQTEEVKELVLLKGLIIVDIEMFAMKSCKNPVKRTTPCAKRRKMSARRKIRTSTYTTEDDDIVGFSYLLSKFGFSEGPKVEAEM